MTAIAKHPPMRSRAALDLAHGMHECTLEIPDACRGYVLEGLEPCHGPKSWLDGGGAMKASDVFAAGCHWCHVELDQGNRLTRDEKEWYWGRGAARTWAHLLATGKLKVVR